ncbi:MAG: sigma-70 family RNA polymerase sigma factor [Acidobacteriota bacterium]|nr:sigma-70 family RNA polymerase sigma factor [Acidobacteriota bacterium]
MTIVDAVGTTEGCVSTERLGELFDTYYSRLYRLARRLSRDSEEARDLVQECFLRVARRADSIPDSESGAEAWLVRTLVNLCRDRHRRLRVRRERYEQPGLSHGPASPESNVVARLSVEAALARLTPRRRAVVVLHELEELGTDEVAGLLGLSRATVRWHLHAARRDLRTILGTDVHDSVPDATHDSGSDPMQEEGDDEG